MPELREEQLQEGGSERYGKRMADLPFSLKPLRRERCYLEGRTVPLCRERCYLEDRNEPLRRGRCYREDRNKPLRRERRYKDHGDRFLNEFVEFTSNNLSP